MPDMIGWKSQTALIKDANGAFDFEKIKRTAETNFPNYVHKLLIMNEFANLIKN